jgi:tetraacyldisaccharide 4'-kinase
MIDRIAHRFETALQKEDPVPVFSVEAGLWFIAQVYGFLMRVRARLYEDGILVSRRLPCRVVSIGNITAGGTGKTPMTIRVAQIIRDQGQRVVVISRGYRGRLEKRGGIVSDGSTILVDPREAGDEPYLMASVLQGIPVVVGRRRYAAGMLAVAHFRPDVIILDDAFQHLRLRRDLNILLLDSRSPFGNGHVLPRGRLREPLCAMGRADVVVLTRCQEAVRPSLPNRLPPDRPLFFAMHTPVVRLVGATEEHVDDSQEGLSRLAGKKVLAFAGLADNDQFFDQLGRAGCIVCRRFAFADHHAYRQRDLDRIASVATATGVDLLVTTVKDFVKIQSYRRWPVELVTVDVTIRMLTDDDRFEGILTNALRR